MTVLTLLTADIVDEMDLGEGGDFGEISDIDSNQWIAASMRYFPNSEVDGARTRNLRIDSPVL
jgi:hypothetical protein